MVCVYAKLLFLEHFVTSAISPYQQWNYIEAYKINQLAIRILADNSLFQ